MCLVFFISYVVLSLYCQHVSAIYINFLDYMYMYINGKIVVNNLSAQETDIFK